MNAEEMRKLKATNSELSHRVDELQRILQVRELEIAKLLHKIEVSTILISRIYLSIYTVC